MTCIASGSLDGRDVRVSVVCLFVYKRKFSVADGVVAHGTRIKGVSEGFDVFFKVNFKKTR